MKVSDEIDFWDREYKDKLNFDLSFGDICEILSNSNEFHHKQREIEGNKFNLEEGNYFFSKEDYDDAFKKFSHLVALEYIKISQGDSSSMREPTFEDFKNKDLELMRSSIFFQETMKLIKDGDSPRGLPDLHQAVALMYNNGKKFEIEDGLFDLLWNTENKIFLRNPPFNYFFINKEIEIINGLKTMGIAVRKGFNEGGKSILILLLGIDSRDKSIFFKFFTINENGLPSNDFTEKEYGDDFTLDENKEIENKVSVFVCNFLDFLNHPEAELRIMKHENNLSRIKRGKLPHLDKITIILKNKLYNYVYEELPKQKRSGFDKKFWVRGHYIHFKNKNRYKRIYGLDETELLEEGYYKQKEMISKWVLPYIKGKGKLVNKDYKLKPRRNKKDIVP